MLNKFAILITFLACSTICHSQDPPKVIDCHVHHDGTEAFLKKLLAKLDSVNGMAFLLTSPKDLEGASEFIKQHPG
ncbi:MAG: hypothetical protein ACRD5Z_24965, partial [Bryobacteraceae bacterium]